MQANLPEILTVSELNSYIKVLIEENFKFVHLIGEISNFHLHIIAFGIFYDQLLMISSTFETYEFREYFPFQTVCCDFAYLCMGNHFHIASLPWKQFPATHDEFASGQIS